MSTERFIRNERNNKIFPGVKALDRVNFSD